MKIESKGVALTSRVVLAIVSVALLTLAVAGRSASPVPKGLPGDFAIQPAEVTAPPGMTHQAYNPAQQLQAYFGEQGMLIASQPGSPRSWDLGIELQGYGYLDGGIVPVDPATLEAQGGRIAYAFSDGLSGWYKNGERGIEQGFLLEVPPAARSLGDTVVLELGSSGQLVGKVAESRIAYYLSRDSRVELQYVLEGARGADGKPIPAHLEQLLDERGQSAGFRIVLQASPGSFPVTVEALVAKDAPPAQTSGVTGSVSDLAEGGLPAEPFSPMATTLISPTGAGGFELGGDLPSNGWTVVNHTTHTWQVSGVAVPFAGTNSAFISNNGGTSYAYTNTLSQTSHFYRDVTVPAGETAITLSWQLKVNGESGFDRLLVYTAPTSVTPVAGTPASSSTTLTGATLVFTGVPISSGTVYATQTVTLPGTLAGTTFRLIFTWQNDTSGGTNPPASVDNISLVSDLPPPPPANDTCPGAIALTLNIPVTGTNANALNDYTITAPAAACFPGVGQTTGSPVGRDTVYSFTAPSAGLYSFRAQTHTSAGGGNLVAFLSKPAGPAYACPAAGGQTCDATLVAANRNSSTSQWAAEEVMCHSLAAGQKVYLFVDELAATTTGGAYIVQVNPCIQETESNGTPATANPLGTACPIEGTISPTAEVDFFSFAPTTVGQRVFAMADGVAGSSNDFDLRVTTSADTLEYDDANLDTPFGSLAPTADGTKATGTSTFIRMSHFSTATASEPYRLYATVRGDSATATPETESNDTLATANAIASGYISATLGSTTDVDYYAVTAAAGDVIFAGMDQDPAYSGTNALDGKMSLRDASDVVIVAPADSSSSTTARAPVLGSLTSSTPTSNGEGLAWRVSTAGTYYIRVELQSGTITTPKPYLLSITNNCIPAGCQTPADCADGNVCTDDVCTAGVCSHPSNTLPCADDGNVCTDDVCSEGSCTHPNNAAPCSDGNPCTSVDTCGGGVCTGTPNTDPCDDGNPCTTGNTCDGGLCGTFNTDPCSDGNPCTLNDACSGGACVPGAPPATVQLCSTDGTLTIPLGPANSPASVYPSTVSVSGLPPVLCKVTVNLNDVKHTWPDDIDIELVAPGTATNALIMSDVGGSTDVPNPPETVLNLTLDDAAVASLPDAGPLASGTFKPTNIGAETTAFPAPAPAVSGGSALSAFNGTDPNGTWNMWLRDEFNSDGGSLGGWCLNLQAVCTTDAQCDDDNVCTDDTCFRGVCQHENNTAECEDGYFCTAPDLCVDGECVSGTNPCEDNNACTVDICDPDGGPCSNPPVDCDDGNVCTDDFCDTGTGCYTVANDNPCSDGDACTINDACANKVCVPGAAPGLVSYCNTDAIAIPAGGGGCNCCDGVSNGGPGCNDATCQAAVCAFDSFCCTNTWDSICEGEAATTCTCCGGAGTATPYPSSITVSGQEAHLCAVKLHLNGLSHSRPDDIDALLVAPGTATNAIVMSDVGGTTAAAGVNLTLADSAATSLPDAGPLVSGTFKPTNVGAGDVFGAPAPAPSGGSALSAFTGSDPNGTWDLYVVDDEVGLTGSLGSGWCLEVSGVCVTDADCNDGNVCTDDTCFRGVCQHVDNSDPCDDGLFCTIDDVCSNGTCGGDARDCSGTSGAGIDFEAPTYSLGTIDGQDGWSSTGAAGSGCAVYDHAVATNSYGYGAFGGQSLRMSNAVTSGCFGDQTFSKSLADEVGERASTNNGLSGGTRRTHFEAEWSFASTVPGAEQPGLSVVASPDRGDGARMSWVQMTDTPGGLDVNFFDYQDLAPQGSLGDPDAGCGAEDDFFFTPVAIGLDRTVPHTIKITLDTFEGPANDVVKVYVDGVLEHTGTSWEDYFRWCEQNPVGISRTVDSILFRTGGTAAPATLGNGFVIDNLTLASGLEGDQCTAGACNEDTDSCEVMPANEGGPCDDGLFCTVDDACTAGTCTGGPKDCSGAAGSECEIGVCNEDADTCEAEPQSEGGPCDDGDACTEGETCQSGTCERGTAVVCNDGNPCTDDFCDSQTGCGTTPNTDPCDDGNPCTVGDTCGGGSCQPGTPNDCDDGNACTSDSCDPQSGCHNDPVSCDDGNPCTDDVCNPQTGCDPTPNSDPCDDGNACTVGDTCGGGACQPGGPANCDDGDDCTVDTCDPQMGCQHELICCNEPSPHTAGFYQRMCSPIYSGPEPLTQEDVDCVNDSCTFADVQTIEDMCVVLRTRTDGCTRAEIQFMGLLLNLCRDHVCDTDPIASSCGDNTTVGQTAAEIDAMLCDGETIEECKLAACEANEVNNGTALNLDTLLAVKLPGNKLRLTWTEPLIDGDKHIELYEVWRSLDGLNWQLAGQVPAGQPMTFVESTFGPKSYQYDVTVKLQD